MIRYDLVCENGHAFDAWFRDSAAFDTQKAQGVLACPNCGSAAVDKALMAPAVGKREEATPLAPNEREAALRSLLRAMRRHVVENAEYVGDRFPEEARRMHYAESGTRGIYGEASTEEVEALFEEGIRVLPMPDVPEERN